MSSQVYLEKPKRGGPNWLENPNSRKIITIAVKTLIGTVLLLYAAFPVIWTLSAAFNSSDSLRGQTLIPAEPTLDNFQQILQDEPFFTWIWNSVKLAGISSIIAGLLTTVSAYAFSRYRFAGRSSLLAGVLLIQVFPNLLAMVAIYALLLQIGQYLPEFGLNSHGGLILVFMGGIMGTNVWLMKGYFDSIPRDLDESALVDGANRFQIFYMIMLPLVRPMVAVVVVLTFFGVYSAWFLPKLLLTNESLYPLMLGLQSFISGQFSKNWGPFAAGAILGALPQLIVYYLLQDWIVGGLTAGSVKG
jgi:ABC-type maltose transport system permease subunit